MGKCTRKDDCFSLAFYGCYFIKMFLQKKPGIQTDQIGKNKVGYMKFVEVTMKIAA